MPNESNRTPTVVGRRMRSRREELGWPQEKVGVLIGLDESSARARISRYELGVHEPPYETVKLLAAALRVPVTYMYCEDDDLCLLLLTLHRVAASDRRQHINGLVARLRAASDA